MANWTTLKAAIADVIKTNGNQEITGAVLQNTLNSIVNAIGENSTFAGIATPTTNPGVPDGNVFYLATKAGTYANFNGIEIEDGEAVILEWRGSWTKKTSGFATQEKLTELKNKAAGIVYLVCSTAAATAEKTVAIDGLTVLTTGMRLLVKMANSNTAANATLNINNLGAKALYYNSARVSGDNAWEAGEVIDLYYDGENFYSGNFQGGKGEGGNIILEWDTDVATTRKQVKLADRKEGMQISYNNPANGWINEQYTHNEYSDFEISQNINWTNFAKIQNIKNDKGDSVATLIDNITGTEAEEKNVLKSVVWERARFDSGLVVQEIASTASPFCACKLDVRPFIGLSIKFRGNGYYGIIKEDGSKTNIGQAVHTTDVEFIIPEGSKALCISSDNERNKLPITVTIPQKESTFVNTILSKKLAPIQKSIQNLSSYSGGFSDYEKQVNSLVSVLHGGNCADDRDFFTVYQNYNLYPVDDGFLKSINCRKIIPMLELPNEQSNSIALVSAPGDGFFDKIHDNAYKLVFSVFVYSYHKVFPSEENGVRITAANVITSPKLTTKIIQINDTESDYVKEYILYAEPYEFVDKDDMAVYLYCTLQNNTGETIKKGEFGVTGFRLGFTKNEVEADTANVWADWYDAPKGASINDFSKPELAEIMFSAKYEGVDKKSYNKAIFNRERISLFIEMLNNKDVDEYNRLLVSMNGDSIIGAQLEFMAKSAEFDTGDFPPNMSRIIVARKFWERYRFKDEDVIFRNLKHSDWAKQGFNIDNGLKSQTFNCIEVFGCNEGDYAEITITGKKFVKFVWSEYNSVEGMGINGVSFDIEQTVDDGEPQIIKSVETHQNVRRLMQDYFIAKLEETKTYKFKIIPKSGFEHICFWGIEAWSKPRLDVVVEASSGSTAERNRNFMMDGYYSDFHRPTLIISDVLALNDFEQINAGNYTLSRWRNDLSYIYNYCKENGVPVLLFCTHDTDTNKGQFVKEPKEVVRLEKYVAENCNIPYIDILRKTMDEYDYPQEAVVSISTADFYHLTDYGQQYYFEEIVRILG